MDGGMQGLVGRRSIVAWLAALTALLGGLVAAGPASAALTIGDPQSIADDYGSVAATPQVLYDSNGRATFIWSDSSDPHPGLKWMRVSPAGVPGTVHEVGTDPYIYNVDAAMDSQGNITAVYTGSDAPVLRIAADGTATSTTAAPGTGYVGAPQLVVAPDDTVSVVWGDGDGFMRMTRYDGDGNALATGQAVASPDSLALSFDVVADSLSRVHVVWTARQSDNTHVIRYVRIAADGTPGSAEVLGDATNESIPQIVVDSSNRVTAAWVADGVSNPELVSRRIAADGTVGDLQTLITGASANYDRAPRLVVDSRGIVTALAIRGDGDVQIPTFVRVAADGTVGQERDLTGTYYILARYLFLLVDDQDRVTALYSGYQNGIGTVERAVRIAANGNPGGEVITNFAFADTGAGLDENGEPVLVGGWGGNFALAQGATTDSDTFIDAEPPTYTSDNTPQVDFSSTDPNATFECSLDGAAFSSCSSPAQLGQLNDGSHTFAVRSTDSEGQTDSTPATSTFTVLTTTPDTKIDSGPADGSASRDSSPAFEFSSTTGGASFECSVDSTTNYEPCSSPAFIGPLPDGQHVFRVRAIDQADNTDPTPASRTFTVDRVRPDTSIASGPADGATVTTSSATFGLGSDEPGAKFECSLDDAEYSACSSPLTLSGLANGPHVLRVRAIDRAGNIDTSPVARSFTVASAPPPPPDDGACDKAKAKLDKAKAKLKKLKKKDAPKAKVKKAKAKVKKAKDNVKKAC
jgi:hypothetical protein